MLIVAHVIAALLGIVAAAIALFMPSQITLRVTYMFTAITFASGSYLVWKLHAPLAQACLSGLVYLTCVVFASVATRIRLSRLNASHIS